MRRTRELVAQRCLGAALEESWHRSAAGLQPCVTTRSFFVIGYHRKKIREKDKIHIGVKDKLVVE